MVPSEYRLASQEFDRFLGEVAAEAGLSTRHQAYTTVQGVLLTFRRRLTIEEAIGFAQVLPPMLRAVFVADWDPGEPRKEFGDLAALTKEVQGLRRDHNFSPDSAIRNVAAVLRRHVDNAAFESCLSGLPRLARDYWDPGE